MNTKQRDVVYQHWRSVIQRETRDLASLEQIRARALSDPVVRDDATLLSMIRADLERRRAELEPEQQTQEPSTTAPESRPNVQPAPPEEVRAAFDGLAQTLGECLERDDEGQTRTVWGQMRALQEENRGVIPAAALEQYERLVGKLRTHLEHLRDQIAALTQRAVAASRRGDEQAVDQSMRRLLSIHAAHPRLLDESGLDGIRASIIQAADQHDEHQLIARKLVERGRAVDAEIKRLAAVVHEFHRVARSAPHTSEEFHGAEAAYLRAIQEVRVHDKEWFAGFVLELAGLLAEWTIPPLGAEDRIDRFLDRISASLSSIRAEMREIETEQEQAKGDTDAPRGT
jgi:hypothetical protein